MNNQRLISQIRSMLKAAIDESREEEISRLHGLLTIIQSDYIRELEQRITDVKLMLDVRFGRKAS